MMMQVLLISLQSMVFALILPWFWAAVVVLVITWIKLSRRDPPARNPRRLELALPFLFAPAILLWGDVLYASLENASGGWHWQNGGVFALLALQLWMVVWLLGRHRARLLPAMIAVLLAVSWAHGSAFLTFMALDNHWI